MRTGHVYALVHVNRPWTYRYVGRTVATLDRRLRRHKGTMASMPHLPVMRWMAKAGPHNVRIVSLAEYPETELPFWECFWMATLREAGHDLTNVAHGGSAAGFPKGYYKHTPETLAKMVAGRRAKNNGGYGSTGGGVAWSHTQEAKDKISAGLARYYESHTWRGR